jgi:hypothetical protein
LQSTCHAIVNADGLKLLEPVAKARKDHEFKQAVLWLLQQAPTKATAIYEKVLVRPSVPLNHAKELVAAGMRFSYAQLLDAANSMVAGVEVWVQAQQQQQQQQKWTTTSLRLQLQSAVRRAG